MVEPGRLILESAEATERFGYALAGAVVSCPAQSATIYLVGDLGAGKTTLARGFLRGLGHAGRVPSPTYTLIEPYQIGGRRVAHIDLYRIRDPSELDHLGLGDALGEGVVALVEWPDHGAGHIPAADILLHLDVIDGGRVLGWQGLTKAGRHILQALSAEL